MISLESKMSENFHLNLTISVPYQCDEDTGGKQYHFCTNVHDSHIIGKRMSAMTLPKNHITVRMIRKLWNGWRRLFASFFYPFL